MTLPEYIKHLESEIERMRANCSFANVNSSPAQWWDLLLAFIAVGKSPIAAWAGAEVDRKLG